MALVVDASIALAWVLPDERDAAAQSILERVLAQGAIAPALWRWEVQNALLMAQRRKRIERGAADEAIAQIRALPIEVQSLAAFGREFEVARKFELSVYDAAYLELAMRTGSDLATADAKLALIAKRLDLLADESAPFL